MADSLATAERRVKVYVLNDMGKWDDRGTGHVRCEKENGSYFLKVIAESTGRLTLRSQVRPKQVASYTMQDETIITWVDTPKNTEIALSFQDRRQCKEIWDKVNALDDLFAEPFPPSPLDPSSPYQPLLLPATSLPPSTLPLPLSVVPSNSEGPDAMNAQADAAISSGLDAGPLRHNSPAANNHVALVDAAAAVDISHSSRFFGDTLDTATPWNSDPIDDPLFRDSSSVFFWTNSPGSLVPQPSGSEVALANSSFAMPEPTRSGVETLSKILADQSFIHLPFRERVISEVCSPDYVSKLCQVFRKCEQTSDFAGLGFLHHVIRCFFLLASSNVLEVLVSQNNLMDIVGCLEYDQDSLADVERRYADGKSQGTGALSAKRMTSESKDVEGDSNAVATHGLSDQQKNGARAEKADAIVSVADQHQMKEHGGGPEQRSAAEVYQKPDGKPVCKYLPSPLDMTSDTRKLSADIMFNEDTEVKTISGRESSSKAGKNVTPAKKKTVEKSSSPSHKADAERVASAANSDMKHESPNAKNFSEETMSSGNQVGEDGERRFMVREHRDFLERKASYKSVVPITDPAVVWKIHQNYRVTFIRDVIFSRLFDENVTSSLSGVILCNNVDIIRYFISGSSSLKELFDVMRNAIAQRKAMKEEEAKLGLHGRDTPARSTVAISSKKVEGRPTVQFSDDVTSHSEDKSILKQSDVVRAVEQSAVGSHSTKSSSASGVTRTTGESKLRVSGDLSTSKEGSSRGSTDKTISGNESAIVDQGLSEKGDASQKGLCTMLRFLRDLCILAKDQQKQFRERFHSLLKELGVLDVFVGLLLNEDSTVRALCCEVLSCIIFHDPSEVRSKMLIVAPHTEKKQAKRIGISLRSAPVLSMPSTNVCLGPKQNRLHATGVAKAEGIVPRKGDSPNDVNINSVDTPVTASGPFLAKDLTNITAEGCQGKEAGPSSVCLSGIGIPMPMKVAMRSLRNKQLKDSKKSTLQSQKATSSIGKSLPKNSEEDALSTTVDPPFSRYTPDASCRVVAVGNGVGQRHGNKSSNRCDQKSDTGAQGESYPLLDAMISVITEDEESGVALSVLDLLKLLLVPTNMRNDKDTFLNAFYKEYVCRLLGTIRRCLEEEERRQAADLPCGWDFNAHHICDLLAYCVSNHTYRAKCFVLSSDVGDRVAALFKHRKSYAKLSALRFIRACACLEDDGVDRYLVRGKLFDPVMDMFKKNGGRDNLVSSAVLEVVSAITSTLRFVLLKYIVEEHSAVLAPSEKYCGAFTEARRVYEDLQKGRSAHVASNSGLEKVPNEPVEALRANEEIDTKATEVSGLGDGEGPQTVPHLDRKDVNIGTSHESAEKGLEVTGGDGKQMEAWQSLIAGENDGAVKEERKFDSQTGLQGSWVAIKTKVSSDGGVKPGSVKSNSDEKGCDETEHESANLGAGKRGAGEEKLDLTKAKKVKTGEEKFRAEVLRICKAKRDLGIAGWSGKSGDCGKGQEGNRGTEAEECALTESNIELKSKSVNAMGSKEIGGQSNGVKSKGFSGMRLSMSKGTEMEHGEDGEQVICESSEDHGSSRKRGRAGTGSPKRGWMADGGIETSTQAVMELHKGGGGNESLWNCGEDNFESPPKRKRTETESGGSDRTTGTEVVDMEICVDTTVKMEICGKDELANDNDRQISGEKREREFEEDEGLKLQSPPRKPKCS